MWTWKKKTTPKVGRLHRPEYIGFHYKTHYLVWLENGDYVAPMYDRLMEQWLTARLNDDGTFTHLIPHIASPKRPTCAKLMRMARDFVGDR